EFSGNSTGGEARRTHPYSRMTGESPMMTDVVFMVRAVRSIRHRADLRRRRGVSRVLCAAPRDRSSATRGTRVGSSSRVHAWRSAAHAQQAPRIVAHAHGP